MKHVRQNCFQVRRGGGGGICRNLGKKIQAEVFWSARLSSNLTKKFSLVFFSKNFTVLRNENTKKMVANDRIYTANSIFNQNKEKKSC